jgi:hypothetical protein
MWIPNTQITGQEQQARWNAVFGAMVAAQVQALWNLRSEAPDEDCMTRFVEEACCIADMVDEVKLGEDNGTKTEH